VSNGQPAAGVQAGRRSGTYWQDGGGMVWQRVSMKSGQSAIMAAAAWRRGAAAAAKMKACNGVNGAKANIINGWLINGGMAAAYRGGSS